MQPQRARQRWESNPVLRGLITSIVQNPDIDEPRLDFAQAWEQAELPAARAQFVRAQIEMARIGGDHPAWYRLAIETQRLEFAYGQEWLPASVGGHLIESTFYRGFLEGVKISCSSLMLSTTREALFSEAPIRHLDIVNVNEPGDFTKMTQWLGTRNASRIQSLSLAGQCIDDAAVLDLCAKYIQLRWLSLANCNLSRAAVETLLQATVRRVAPRPGTRPGL